MIRSSWNSTLYRLKGSIRQTSSIPHLSRHLSSTASATREETQGSNDVDDTMPPKQPFATFELDAGEWDIERKDPFHRPKPPQRSRLISAEDFANRPPVGFDNEFASYDDAMILLSWLDQKTCKQIFQSYLSMMMRAQKEFPGRTSHEYVCRVLAQQYQITPWRAAGVIQLQHNEEQMRQQRPDLLCEEQAKHAEEMIKRNINDAYRADRESVNPNKNQRFVEDPVGIHGRGAPDEMSSSFVPADDIFDMEAKLKAANERDEKLARVLIDNHVYKEDVDESTLEVKTDGTSKRLLKEHELQRQRSTTTTEREIPYPETNAQGEKRPRWKYVAKVVNTRDMRKSGRRQTSYSNNNMANTLVEEDGNLRVATIEEAKQVAWKPSRKKGNQYIYEGVQRAWLDHTILGKTGVWGIAPRRSAAAAVEQAEGFETPKKLETAATTAAVNESSLSEKPLIDEVMASGDVGVDHVEGSATAKDTDDGNAATNNDSSTDASNAVADERNTEHEQKK
jgi:hypothetical protein